jgi:hypothetical protein
VREYLLSMCPMLLHASGGYGSNFLDVTQLVQRYLKDAGIEAKLKLEAPGVWRVSGPDHVRIVHIICSYKSPRASRSPFDKSGAGGMLSVTANAGIPTSCGSI